MQTITANITIVEENTSLMASSRFNLIAEQTDNLFDRELALLLKEGSMFVWVPEKNKDEQETFVVLYACITSNTTISDKVIDLIVSPCHSAKDRLEYMLEDLDCE